jgi:hypothetical protein
MACYVYDSAAQTNADRGHGAGKRRKQKIGYAFFLPQQSADMRFYAHIRSPFHKGIVAKGDRLSKSCILLLFMLY